MKKPTFIITRPLHQTSNLCEQIKKIGGDVILFPTIEIFPTNNLQKLNFIFSQPEAIHKIIFVSANAVRAVMPYWPKTIKSSLFAIGSGTANALREYHMEATVPTNGSYHSEGLLALPEMQSLSDQTIIIFSGEGGRTLLAESLQQRGAKVKKIAVYQRIKPEGNISASLLNEWQRQTITAIIVTSAEGLKNLHAMAADEPSKSWLHQQQLLVISPAMAELAQQLGFVRSSLLAKNASDAAILEAFDIRG